MVHSGHGESVASHVAAGSEHSLSRQPAGLSPGILKRRPTLSGVLERTLAFKLGFHPSSGLCLTWLLDLKTVNIKKYLGDNVVQLVPSFRLLEAELRSFDTRNTGA